MRTAVYRSSALFSCVDGQDNQWSIYILRSIKVRTDLFNQGQRQNTKAYFYVELELEVDVQMSPCTGGSAVAFTMWRSIIILGRSFSDRLIQSLRPWERKRLPHGHILRSCAMLCSGRIGLAQRVSPVINACLFLPRKRLRPFPRVLKLPQSPRGLAAEVGALRHLNLTQATWRGSHFGRWAPVVLTSQDI